MAQNSQHSEAYKVWKTVYERFDPWEPPRDPNWRVKRAYPPKPDLAEEIMFADARVLLRGTPGSGKTTEVLRFAADQAGEHLVVVLDLVRHFSESVNDSAALQNVQGWEICFLAGLAVMRAAEEQWDHTWDKKRGEELFSSWRKVASISKPRLAAPEKIDVTQLIKKVALHVSDAVVPGTKPTLNFLSAVSDSVTWNIPLGVSETEIEKQDSDVLRLLNATNRIIADVQGQYKSILLIIDGLDRVEDLERAKSLFIRSEIIANLACRTLVCAPFVLNHDLSLRAVKRFRISRLVNEPVLDQAAPYDCSKHGRGVEFFTHMFHKRVEDLGHTFVDEEQLKRLAYFSGGRARDFIKLVRILARKCFGKKLVMATQELVDETIEEMRYDLETGLHSGHVKVLEQVARNPNQLPEGPHTQELLTFFRLLPYPNEKEWFYRHPLLLLHTVNAEQP